MGAGALVLIKPVYVSCLCLLGLLQVLKSDLSEKDQSIADLELQLNAQKVQCSR